MCSNFSTIIFFVGGYLFNPEKRIWNSIKKLLFFFSCVWDSMYTITVLSYGEKNLVGYHHWYDYSDSYQ